MCGVAPTRPRSSRCSDATAFLSTLLVAGLRARWSDLTGATHGMARAQAGLTIVRSANQPHAPESAESLMLARSAAAAGNSWSIGGFRIALARAVSPASRECEAALLAAGRGLPLPHRAAWAALQLSGTDSWFMSVSDGAGKMCGGFGLSIHPSRALPGHALMRCEHFGPGVPRAAQRAALTALVALARNRSRVLRVLVETFAIDPLERVALEEDMQRLGFIPQLPPRCYEETLLLSLVPDEASLFGSLHRTARQNIRAAEKHGLRAMPVEDSGYFDRLDAISRETYARTGGTYHAGDWDRVVALCREMPAASRLVGLFRNDASGPESLLAFAWGWNHGDHVQYTRAASTRVPGIRLSLMYPLLWDLILWAKQGGARRFDFGGVTTTAPDQDDPLRGISDFKRSFSGELARVGAEWCLEPRPVRARAARAVSSLSRMLSRS